MGFFDELPAVEPEPPAPHRPWDPPQAELPGIVPIQTLTIGRTDRAAVAVTGLSAFAEGFEVFVTVRARAAGVHEWRRTGHALLPLVGVAAAARRAA
jgi:hypothetical protein